MKRSTLSGNRICIVCDTPYQLLNGINFACHQNEFEPAMIDALICNRDIDEQQIQSVEQLQLFGKVYRYRTDLVSPGKKRNVFYRANRFFRPEKYVRSLMIDDSFDIREYSCLICAFPIPMTVAMTAINPDISVRLIDDGIGTYIGQIPSPDSKKRRMLFRLRGKTSPWSRLSTIYVNNENIYSGNITDTVTALPPIREDDERIKGALERVFPYKGEDYYDSNRIIYLTQPLETIFSDQDRFWSIEKSILRAIEGSRVPAVVRKHPKHKVFLDHSMQEDKANDQWELVCARQIRSDHVLISCYSTAQFSPKFLFDKEPWLIFTYLMYDELFDSEKISEMEKMIARMRSYYKDSNKIAVVKDADDLKNQLGSIYGKE